MQRSTAILFLTPVLASAGPDYYRHIFFDNSRTPDRYYYSGGSLSEPSRLTLDQGRLPVETKIFRTPPNALRLQWKSEPGGAWEAEVRIEQFRNRPVAFDGDTLAFWCFSLEALPAARMPRIRISDGVRGSSLPIGVPVGVPAGRWVRVKIPLRSFSKASWSPFDPRKLQSVDFLQGAADAAEHTLIIDEISIDTALETSAAPPPPKDLKAAGYERHIDLSWQDAAHTSAERYVIYRSFDGVHYQPIGIQDSRIRRFADFLGKPGMKAYYKVAASDRGYRESGLGKEVSSATRALSEDELLSMVQEGSFRYYWEGAHPDAGMALENIPGDENMVATGASGFGIMALIAGVERGFISREQGAARMRKIANFLDKADRFHGAWAHFMDGRTGKALLVFGKNDNGGDLVETAFLVQGLLAARQYFRSDPTLFAIITRLWEAVEWDWYRKSPGSGFLYWHWSPEYAWRINHPLVGWNETMIVYLLAIASPTHPVPASLYYSGWASLSEAGIKYRGGVEGDHYANGKTYEGIKLDVSVGNGGPLFFTHYSYLGFDPRALRDRYANYFENNRNIALVNRAYCIRNPVGYPEYGAHCWGITASDDMTGYHAHEPVPARDNGTIAPTGALASFPYTPGASMEALKFFYRELGDRLWGAYGLRDAFNLKEDWFAPIYMGLNQAPITVMIENHRSGLIWKSFMANPEIQSMLEGIQREK